MKERLRKQNLRKELRHEIEVISDLLDGSTLSVAQRIQNSRKLDDLKLKLEQLH